MVTCVYAKAVWQMHQLIVHEVKYVVRLREEVGSLRWLNSLKTSVSSAENVVVSMRDSDFVPASLCELQSDFNFPEIDVCVCVCKPQSPRQTPL